ncbi:hypothetical protein, partial [Akkermansia sp.]
LHENRNTGGKLIAFLESANGEGWEAMLAEIGIRYLKITHAGRLEGAKARRIKQFRESELKYIKPIFYAPAEEGGKRRIRGLFPCDELIGPPLSCSCCF